MTCLIDKLLRLEAVVERNETRYDDWTGAEVKSFVPVLTTKAAFVQDTTTQKTEHVEFLELEYTENMHVAYIPYSDIPKELGYTLRVDTLRFPIVGVLDMGARHQWTQLTLGKGVAV